MKVILFLALISLFALPIRASDPCPDIDAVNLNVTKYLGIWYEIATSEFMRLTWEHNCDCTYANYTADEKGVLVTNGCRRGSVTTPYTFAIGQAIIPDPSQPGKLAVRFSNLSPYAPYWVIIIDPDYTQAVIWSCNDVLNNEEYSMWIIARTQTIPQSDYDALVQKTSELTGIDAAKAFIPTTQAGCKPVV